MSITNHAADDLAATIFGDDIVLSRQQLSERLGISVDVIKDAVEMGKLREIRVSSRRLVTTREALAAYLRTMNNGGRE